MSESLVEIILAVDDFDPDQLSRIEAAAMGWAIVTPIPMRAPGATWRQALAGRATIAIGWPPAEEVCGSRLRLVQLGSSGWDGYADAGLDARGIALCNARGIYSTGVAEHAIGMMFALVRRIPEHVHDKDQRLFRRHAPYPDEIGGSVAVIVGMGSIGEAIAERCRGLGMRVVGVARHSGPGEPAGETRIARTSSELASAVLDADHLFLAMPGSADNADLVDAEVLGALRPTARLYNVSRGSVIDEDALCDALEQGRLAGAGLDVTRTEPLPTRSRLWSMGDRLLITGHSAGVSSGYPERFAKLVVENLGRFRQGEPLVNRVI